MIKPGISSLCSVEDARAQTLLGAGPLEVHSVGVEAVLGRVLAQDIIAQNKLPPEAVSAMDGYAVISADVAHPGAQLCVVGAAPAGGRYEGSVTRGQAVRIFTGGPIPHGCDRVVIQENVTRLEACEGKQADLIKVPEAQLGPAHIRAAGIDFTTGDTLCRRGEGVNAHLPGLIAAANYASVQVFKQPRIGIISSGDELVAPGASLQRGQIINSAAYGLAGLCQIWGADSHILGILPDDMEAAAAQLEGEDLRCYDIVVTIGGASVGDRDLVKPVLRRLGAKITLEKVALKPGKPYWTGTLDRARIIGLPGNPSSAFVCAYLFLKPLIYCCLGRPTARATDLISWPTQTRLSANGDRESYLRASFDPNSRTVKVFSAQDSSLLSTWARATCLVQRKAGAKPVEVGEFVPVLPFD